jgi:predicted dehydrogenase
VPTRSHLEVARVLLERGVPCLVEKPLASDTDEGRQLVEIARQKAVPLMVGHVERFNPIVVALLERGLAPRFAEAHRVSPYSFRSADVGVVMDVMIHDIDLILHLIPSPVRSVHAVGFGVLGEHEDLANARVIFEDGSVANVTASRLALKTERKLRLFAPDCYVSLDLLKKVGRIVRPGPGLQREIERAKADLGSMNPLQIMLKRLVRTESISAKHGEEPLKAEDREFLAAVREARDPAVSGEHGLLAMEAARLVQASIRENLSRA